MKASESEVEAAQKRTPGDAIPLFGLGGKDEIGKVTFTSAGAVISWRSTVPDQPSASVTVPVYIFWSLSASIDADRAARITELVDMVADERRYRENDAKVRLEQLAEWKAKVASLGDLRKRMLNAMTDDGAELDAMEELDNYDLVDLAMRFLKCSGLPTALRKLEKAEAKATKFQCRNNRLDKDNRTLECQIEAASGREDTARSFHEGYRKAVETFLRGNR